MTTLYKHATRDDLVRKRDLLVETSRNLGRVMYRFTVLSGDEQIALGDAIRVIGIDLRDVREAIARIDATLPPTPINDIDVFDLAEIA